MSILNNNKKALALGLAVATVATSVQPVISFADEVIETAETTQAQPVNITNFKVTKDGDQRVAVLFTIDQELDLGVFTKDNVIIKVENKDGSFSKSKSKTWEGFLNDAEGNKYGMGTKLPAGTYSTVFDYTQLSGKTLDDIRVELVVNNDGLKTTKVFDTSVVEPPVAPEVTKITTVTTNAPDQVLVEFDLSEDINLKLDSKDNIIIRAINKNSGEVLTTKNKTWSGYLNDTKGNKVGKGQTAQATTYQTVFSNAQIEYINPSDIAIELEVIKDGEVLALDDYNTNESAITTPVNITDVVVNRDMEEALSLSFNIDQTLNLGLDTKDNIIIQAIDKNTGEILATKNKTWTGYLNDATDKYGLGSIVRAGQYSTTFNASQLQYTKPEDVVIKIQTIQNGVVSEYVDGKISEEPEATKPVNIDNVAVTEFGEGGAKVDFSIDKNINLKLTSKDNIIIKAYDRVTKEVLTTKNKTWTDYLNAENGEQFGLNELVLAGNYSNVFNAKQLKGRNLEDVAFEITVVRNGVKNSVQINHIEVPNIEDIENHWAKDNIEEFMSKGYINGYGDDTFRPDDAMTRAEFIKVVNRVFNLKEVGEVSFSDVNKDEWYYDEVAIAVNAGYINGYNDNTFRPDKLISREEAAKVIAGLVDLQFDGEIDFKDKEDISDWAIDSVDELTDNGIINGYSDNTFRPKNIMTRAEAVTALSRTIK